MKNPNAYLVAAFGVAFSVLLIIPMWWAYGVLLPHDGGHAHGSETTVSSSEFEEKAARFIKEHQLPDGSVRAEHGKPIYVMARNFKFQPNVLRLPAGAEYDLQMLSTDVVHAISVQMSGTSYNAVVMPGIVTTLKLKPTKPGKYLVLCNEYCGFGHDYMYFHVIVEEDDGKTHREPHGKEPPEKTTTPGKDDVHGHGKH